MVLSKFVRQMGDLLPSTLYISYLRMLKGLANGPQCAHYCFSLLKTNGATHSKSRWSLFTHFQCSNLQFLLLEGTNPLVFVVIWFNFEYSLCFAFQ